MATTTEARKRPTDKQVRPEKKSLGKIEALERIFLERVAQSILVLDVKVEVNVGNRKSEGQRRQHRSRRQATFAVTIKSRRARSPGAS